MPGVLHRGGTGAVAPLARALAATVDVDATAERVTDDIMATVWSAHDDPEFRTAVGMSVRGNVAAIYDIMLARVELEAARPQQALEFADLSAELGVPAAELERAYRVGQASVWSQWLDLATSHAAREELPLTDFVDEPSRTILGYVDHIMASVTERYDLRVGEQQRTRRELRRLLVRQLLDGTIGEAPPELDAQLGYCVGDTHLALLLHPVAGGLGDAALAELRSAADARDTLVLQHGPGSWLVWLGRPAGFGRPQLSRLRRTLVESPGAAAVGEPAAGLAGLRRSYEQAVDTARVQLALGLAGNPCVWAADVRLEALLLADSERAAQFVRDELGRLAAQDTLACRLRETLLAWLSTNSHVSAAAQLGVHENTIRNRIRQAEELLDAPLALRRTELQVALRLERVLRAEAGG